jgi:hypothetical protein
VAFEFIVLRVAFNVGIYKLLEDVPQQRLRVIGLAYLGNKTGEGREVRVCRRLLVHVLDHYFLIQMVSFIKFA